MTTPLGYDELLQCPFEKAHRIQAYAMSKHLFKCRRNHPNKKFITCPFNETHQVAAIDLHSHVTQCLDRAAFDTYKYSISTLPATVPCTSASPTLVYNNSPPKYNEDSPPIVEEENWDDSNVPAYNPQAYCLQANVIRKATLKKPAEKKVFYEKEEIRINKFKPT